MQNIENTVRTYLTRIIPRPSLFFDVEVTDHCNLNCKGCGSFAPLAGEKYLDVNDFESDLIKLSTLANGEVHHINILGGEPLLHPQIERIMEMTRHYFPKGNINLVTNGILLLQMKESFWNCCKKNMITLAPTKYPININYEKIEKIAVEYGVQYTYFGVISGEGDWNHTVITKEANRNEVHSFLNCGNANNCTVLKDGKIFPCPRVAKIDLFNKAFGTDFHVSERDYIDISEVDTLEDIMRFLSKPIPFCKYCNRFANSKTNWEISKKMKEEWT